MGEHGDASGIKPNRALPGMYADKILFGLPPKEARDRRKIYGACVSIAMSARKRGWTETDYTNEIARRESRLWDQLNTGRDGRPSSPHRAYNTLWKAWKAGVANINDVGERTKDDIRAEAVERAFMWTDRLTHGLDGLTPTEAAVMQYVVTQTEQRGMLRVTCPGREVAEYAKISHATAARTLRALTEKCLLTRFSPGRRGKDGTGKAAIYGLGDPLLNRGLGNGSCIVEPSAQVCYGTEENARATPPGGPGTDT
jgi:hypothetical protein